jgi:hypothetical protein
MNKKLNQMTDFEFMDQFKNHESKKDYEKRKNFARPIIKEITKEIISWFFKK